MRRVSKNSKLTEEDIKKYTRNFWTIIIACVAFGFLFILSVRLGVFGKLPSFQDLENPKSNLASEVLTEDNKVLGTYYVQNRSNVKYSELSPYLVQALIATEDKRFYKHAGIDYWRTMTVIFHTMTGNKQGGSTITQQLALNLFSDGRAKSFSKRIFQKFQEWVTAVRLERNYTKEEIITMYFNTVDFGAYNTFGIKSAARTYFNTTPDKLTAEQAALLVGMLKGPGVYSPVRYPENALGRRNVVLNNMYNESFITKAEETESAAKPLGLQLKISNYGEGLAPYFRAVLKEEIKKEFARLSITKSDGTPYDLDRDGLKIYSTINYTMQQYAEEAQKKAMKELQGAFDRQWKGRTPFSGKNAQLLISGMKRSDRYRMMKDMGASEEEIKKAFNTKVPMNVFTWRGSVDTVMTPMDSIKYNKLFLRNAMMSMEPQTGHIKAWVGGINFEHFKYDQVKLGTRQVGSTAKPFTYAVAVDNGYSPCYSVPNFQQTYGNWTPKGTVQGGNPITLKKALAYSQNYATAYLINEVGASAVANLTQKMGITSKVPSYPSIALGAYEASVFDMVGAYSAFVNSGTWVEPTMIMRIEDKSGTTIYEKAPKVVKALNSETAYIMVDMLKGVVDGGTATRIKWFYKLNYPIGGKTGTTNDNSDAWFIGVTPQLVTGVWTGAEDRGISFYSTNEGQGARAAMPVFAYYMQKVYGDSKLKYTKEDFPLPAGGLTRELDCGKYAPFNGTGPATDENLDDDRLGF
ncbi:transglycosylase domain-containing protein [Sphingobacterium spiritivorum]|uniref:Transglycosylase n=1 Tax=Sphingobacterium spiritivorum ATCC 33861 TaxID=525373 RepID=D7VJI1_SPHSI|nr:transglycosylase domain-containing protein [Sphingobacterium spiritivorum]EFK59034.1 transglycosylase [Sphingobacterium spiritivorum ATCC 33861]QQT36895.1 transglycosylase domain-containing protein [Sphingobacterium spiritivorum]WQD33654.1 transglycosylase domain-containing protein [Sphingobacterium spiritivorum]SUJ25859.1 Penicillin-binding protein 1A [Sphingobacterium spiritivorum]